jgi:DNA helicase-2/ATP-dependent DNA helicase PcrA
MRYALNKAQQIAVDSESPKILCLAGAGTGKTRTLIERIVGLVNRGVAPSSILALTFTNAAAFEMKERYREYVDSGESPEFRTFHSYCYDLMSKDIKVRNALGYTSMPSIADDYKQKRIESEALTQSGIRLSKTKISDPASLSMKEKKDYEILMKFRKRLMVKENLITFDELCQGVCKLFISKDPIVDKYRNMIKYLHVDEYQDTDKVQHNFVMSFSDSANIFVVGDSLQSLYRLGVQCLKL